MLNTKNLFKISKPTLKSARNRFLQLIFISILLSGISMVFNLSGETTQSKAVISTSICAAVFLLINVVFMRDNYYVLGSKRRYFKANLIAYFLFMLLTVIVYLIDNTAAYTWLFMITKFMVYTVQSWSTILSTAVFHLVMIVAVFMAPLGMYSDEEYEE